MNDDIIDSRGYFWSAEIDVPAGHFAPENSVTGRMRVLADGRTQLDLDGTLDISESGSAFARAIVQGEIKGAICGFLIDSVRHIRLTDVTGSSTTLGTIGPSHERLVAYRCLVSREAFKPGVEPRFRWLDLPLNGYEEWLGWGHIAVTGGPRSIKANYAAQRQPQRWKAGSWTLELHRYLSCSGEQNRTEIAWRERSFFRIGSSKPELSFEQAIDLAQRIEDLLVLMADHDQRLAYGTLLWAKSSKPVEFYYARGDRDKTEKIHRHKAWVLFKACSNEFGDLVGSWFDKYEVYGPGFHLYLGNRRGQPMYHEHRFASLMWGLEALHRILFPAECNAAQARKVDRILAQISAKKDRDWAARFLPMESEPSLANRLIDLISKLGLCIDPRQTAQFAERCARRRNDISHFGGRREIGGYDEFLEDIIKFSHAIDLLYHALLLQIIGVPDRLVRSRFIGGYRSYFACATLADVGLVIPDPPAAQA